MTHDEAMEGQPVTQKEALTEIRKHGADEADFFKDNGVKSTYSSAEVLCWLGY